MSVAVVGGAGYVGAVLTTALVQAGRQVTVIDRCFYGEEPLAEVRDRIGLVKKDGRNLTADDFDDVEAVVHLAGLSNDPTAEFDPKANMVLNTEMAAHVAKVAKDAGVRRFILASTCSVYDGLPTDEPKDENTQVTPKAAYASSKHNAENDVLEQADRLFSVIVLRKGTIGGWSPRMRFDLVVNQMVRDAVAYGQVTVHAGGAMWRPLLDVNDAARTYLVALNAPQDVGGIFNVVSENVRISELALRVAEVAREYTTLRPRVVVDDTPRVTRSYRAKQDLHFGIATTPVEDTAKNVLEGIHRAGLQGLDLGHPRFHNMDWMRLLLEHEDVLEQGPLLT